MSLVRPLRLTVIAILTHPTTEKAGDVQEVRADTPVTFAPDPEDNEDVELSGVASGPAVGIDEDISMEIMETTAADDVLKLWPWVNQVRGLQ